MPQSSMVLGFGRKLTRSGKNKAQWWHWEWIRSNGALQGAFHERCMLPLIDMCNHNSNHTTCSLRVRLLPSGEPRCNTLHPLFSFHCACFQTSFALLLPSTATRISAILPDLALSPILPSSGPYSPLGCMKLSTKRVTCQLISAVKRPGNFLW